MGELLEEGERSAGEAVVEGDAGAWGHVGDEAEGAPEGVQGEVGDDAQPGEEGRGFKVKVGSGELIVQTLAFEVDGDVADSGGDLDPSVLQHAMLPGLGRGMVDLEDLEALGVVAVGEGVEARAEEAVLADSCGVGNCELLFGVAAAGDEKSSKGCREGATAFVWGPAKLFGVGGAKDADGERIFKEQGAVDDLVSGATQGYPEGGAGG